MVLRRGGSKVAAAAMLVVAMLLPASSARGQSTNATKSDAVTSERAAGHRTLSAELRAEVERRLARSEGRATAYVELAVTPAIDAAASSGAKGASAARQAGAKAKRDTDTTANSVVAELKRRDPSSHEVARTRNALSGVIVTGSPAAIEALTARPDVVNITPVTARRVENAHAAVLSNVLAEWQSTGVFGDGIRIGIIDTGVDYTHADFGGPGTPEAFAAIDPTAPTGLFPTAKVVGGTDLAGEDYDADDPDHDTPVPDGNPLGCDQHGTHVAGIAAGFGVNGDGSTFTDDYSALTADDLNGMIVGPGMAPKALVYAIKVFGCPGDGEAGKTALAGPAMDWALDPNGDSDFSDHLDVINLSLGADYAAPDDPEAQIVRRVVQAGVLPVFSAGNSANLYDIGSDAPEALSVASSRDNFDLLDGAEVTAPGSIAGVKAGNYGFAFKDPDFDTGPTRVVKMTQNSNLDGCDPFNATDAARVAGKFVWVEWDDDFVTRRCTSTIRSSNAVAAGAAGMLIAGTRDHFDGGINGSPDIPVFQFTASATAEMRSALNAGTLRVRLAAALRQAIDFVDPSIEDTTSNFTSRGTRTPGVKPDVAAPGDTIVSANIGTGTGGDWLSGTSMAAPHAAGIAALVRSAHPDWTVSEVKAAVMDTANHDVFSGDGQTPPIEAPNRVGSGRVDALAAVTSDVLAYDDDAPAIASVGFGTVEVAQNMSITRAIRVVNKGADPVTFDAAYQAITTTPGAAYSLDHSSITVPGHASTVVHITLTLTRNAMRKTHDPTISELQEVDPHVFLRAQTLADASGRVVLTPTAGTTVPLRVAVYAAPKPTAAITTPTTVTLTNNQGVLPLQGRGLDQGTGTQRYRALYSVMELAATSPELKVCTPHRTSRCALVPSARGGDIRYVGIASDAPQAVAEGHGRAAKLAFAIATYQDWANLGSRVVPFVDIDVDGDGIDDFETFLNRDADTDVLEAWTITLDDFTVVDFEPIDDAYGNVDTNTYDSNVVVLPVFLDALGIDVHGAATRLHYFVGVDGSYAAPDDSLIDFVGKELTFDPVHPGLTAQGNRAAIMYAAQPGTSLGIVRDPVALRRDGNDSLLVVNLHNATPSRATVVKLNIPAGAAVAPI